MPQTDKEVFRIKPLNFQFYEREHKRGHKATALDRIYDVFCLYDELTGWSHTWFMSTNDLFCQPCASPEEGKQLAEAHWTAYIKRALVEAQQ